MGTGRCVTLRAFPRPDGTRRYGDEQIAAATRITEATLTRVTPRRPGQSLRGHLRDPSREGIQPADNHSNTLRFEAVAIGRA